MLTQMITTAGQYAKQWSLKTRWQMKKDSGQYTAHINSLRDAFAPVSPQEAEDRKMGEITAKVTTGTKLTREEMDFLRVKNPQLYAKVKAIEEEQKEYEKELRRCRTQDQAHRLHMAQTARCMEAAKDGDSLALYRLNRMTESKEAFTKTEAYRKLPIEQEESAARAEVRKAREEAVREEQAEAAEAAQEQAEAPGKRAEARPERAEAGLEQPEAAEREEVKAPEQKRRVPTETAEKPRIREIMRKAEAAELPGRRPRERRKRISVRA